MTGQEYQAFRKAIYFHNMEMAKAISAVLLPVWDSLQKFCHTFRETIWKCYEKAGMPYGTTDEGMWRWMRECAKAARLRREAEEIELYHRQMAMFRRMVEERKGQ